MRDFNTRDNCDELFPRDVKALARAVREAEAWRGAMGPDSRQLEEFDQFIKKARQALKIVRELAAQHQLRRKVNSSSWRGRW